MKQYVRFALACLTVIGVALGVLWIAYGTAADRHAILVSAVAALVVQLGAFAVALALARTNVMAGWGAGAILRLAALAIYALVVVPPLNLPPTAALVSLALYLFLSTLVEPFFLKP